MNEEDEEMTQLKVCCQIVIIEFLTIGDHEALLWGTWSLSW